MRSPIARPLSDKFTLLRRRLPGGGLTSGRGVTALRLLPLLVFALIGANYIGAFAAVGSQPQSTPMAEPEGLAILEQFGQSTRVSKLARASLEEPLRGRVQPTPVTSLDIPFGCVASGLYSAPHGPWAVVQVNCESGGYLIFVNLRSALVWEPDSLLGHEQTFLAWEPAGNDVIVRLDAVLGPQVVRVHIPDGRSTPLDVPISTYNLSFRPDGKKILYATTDGVGWGSSLWIADADGSDARRLLQDTENLVIFPSWSPDGKSLAYISMADNTIPFLVGDLWVGGEDGGGLRRIASVDGGHGFAPAWAPDGRSIAFVHRENPGSLHADIHGQALESSVYVVSLADGSILPVSGLNGKRVNAPAYSPDGAFLAYASQRDGAATIWLRDWANGELTPLFEAPGELAPGWIAGE